MRVLRSSTRIKCAHTGGEARGLTTPGPDAPDYLAATYFKFPTRNLIKKHIWVAGTSDYS